MPHLVSVISASNTAEMDGLDMAVLASQQGEEPAAYPFFYRPTDPFGIAPQVKAWLAAHPEFPIGDYVPPAPGS